MSNGNGNRRPGRPQRAAPRRPTAGQSLVTSARSDLHMAGIDLFDFFQTMINPEDLPPERIPDSHGAMSAVFKTPFVVDLPYSGVWNPDTRSSSVIDEKTPSDGYSEVILCPGTTDCYFHTLGDSATLFPSVDTSVFGRLVPVLASHPLEIDRVDLPGVGFLGPFVSLAQGLRSSGRLPSQDVALLPKRGSDGNYVFEIIGTPADDTTFTFQLQWNNRGEHVPTSIGGWVSVLWSDDSNVSVEHTVTSYGAASQGGPGDAVLYSFASPAPGAFIRAFAVGVNDIDPASHWVYSLLTQDSLVVPSRSATAFKIVSAPEMNELSETLSERTSALTGLLTYMGSTLQDGGQISAARLGMGLSPLRSPAGDVYSYLASLPFYNDDFALREGIYSWWLPDSVQEHFYVPYQAPRSAFIEENSVLQFAVLRDTPTQAVRLKVIQNLEVLTRSRLYTSATGPINPSFASVIGAVKTVPAVTINSKHIPILRRALAAVRSWVSKPANWRRLLSRGASVLTRLMPGSAPARAMSGLDAAFG